MDKNRINQLGHKAVSAIVRVQIDAILSVLSDSDRNKYQTKLFENIQVLLDKTRPNLSQEEFEFFKGLLEDGSIGSELR